MDIEASRAGVPAAVRQLAGADRVRLVWENELGGLTFQLGNGAERRFVKWVPAGAGIDLSREIGRLTWAADYIAVPGSSTTALTAPDRGCSPRGYRAGVP